MCDFINKTMYLSIYLVIVLQILAHMNFAGTIVHNSYIYNTINRCIHTLMLHNIWKQYNIINHGVSSL